MSQIAQISLPSKNSFGRTVAGAFRNYIGLRQPRRITDFAKILHQAGVIGYLIQKQSGLSKYTVIVAYAARAYERIPYIIVQILLICIQTKLIPIFRNVMRSIISCVIGICGQRRIMIKASVI